MPGPIITKLGFDVWVSEAPTFNRSPVGTQLRLWKATTIVLGTLHGFQPSSIHSPIYADEVQTRLERERTYIEKDQPGTLIDLAEFVFLSLRQVAARDNQANQPERKNIMSVPLRITGPAVAIFNRRDVFTSRTVSREV